jgi:hypothetical protein
MSASDGRKLPGKWPGVFIIDITFPIQFQAEMFRYPGIFFLVSLFEFLLYYLILSNNGMV